jgi:hypothetical protein
MSEQAFKRGSWLLAAIGLAVAAALMTRDASILPSPREAQALENPIESRQTMVQELKQINQKLDRLIQLFESGKVKVVVGNAEELKTGLAPPPAPKPAEKKDGEQPNIIIRKKVE